ncbi:hypothetical protein ARTHRO9AX_150224 [Arthrobacter sp. 9AX]|nr:hypothetical protein ARTHRO9AX_150224 [Arthrobacter sp. 9AX]
MRGIGGVRGWRSRAEVLFLRSWPAKGTRKYSGQRKLNRPSSGGRDTGSRSPWGPIRPGRPDLGGNRNPSCPCFLCGTRRRLHRLRHHQRRRFRRARFNGLTSRPQNLPNSQKGFNGRNIKLRDLAAEILKPLSPGTLHTRYFDV